MVILILKVASEVRLSANEAVNVVLFYESVGLAFHFLHDEKLSDDI